jgi:hypothetical protein
MNLIKQLNYIKICIAISVVISITILLTPSLNWEHSESWFFLYRCLDQGIVKDSFWANIFNMCLDGWTPRTRLLSWFSFVINANVKMWIYNFVPYHATFSVTWIFTLGLLPFFIYKMLKQLNIEKELAIQITCLYFFTMGHLSTHLMFFHQAKPMSAFFLIINLYLFLKLYQDKKITSYKRIIFLTITMFLGTMWDELFFFAYPATLIITFVKIPISKNTIKELFVIYGTSFSLFYLSITYLIPKAFWNLNRAKFDFWNYALAQNDGLQKFSFVHILENGRDILFDHFLYFPNQNTQYFNSFWIIPIFIFIVIATLKSQNKKLTIATLLLMIIFFVFESLILSRRGGRLFLGSFYWGNLFSVIYIVFLASIFNQQKNTQIIKYVQRILIIVLAIIGVNNSINFSKNHESSNLNQVTSDESKKYFGFEWKNFTGGLQGKLEWKHIMTVWGQRENWNNGIEAMKEIPINGYWIYMYHYKKHHKMIYQNDQIWGFEKVESQ